ncbi:hypothetical protein JCM3775_007614 [Rhodotorula graminis]|uniref:Membrane magnesium transporter n=1 Tax=Rhodotorula graminis (strain WP1) TaxID=578459 RepID=A0A0P9EK45_RHOGW|nr:uncharacterized protein RHOBADRAFT_66983 [Rhodotorula graminis WP1]KPV72034.1 hypothetical protein RHOBADRAFT_66983 [Rhodotorula graminis WP1]
MLARLIIVLASAALLHSAYSAWLARTSAKALGIHLEPTLLGSHLPLAVTLEAFASFLLLTVGILLSAPPPKGVSFASEMASRSIDSTDSGVAFANLRHRGRILFGPSPAAGSSAVAGAGSKR